MKRKILCRVLVIAVALVLMVAMSVTSFAASMPTKSADIKLASSASQISKLFNSEVSETIDQNFNVTYNYTIDNKSDNSALVTINGVISGAGVERSFEATGEIERLLLEDNTHYLEGPLRGSIEIDNSELEMVIGFRGIEELDLVSVGMTIYTENQDAIFMMFGNLIKDSQLRDKITVAYETSGASPYTVEAKNAQVASRGSFSYEGSDTASMKTSSLSTESGTGVYLKVYLDTTDKRVWNRVNSYTYKFSGSDFPSVANSDFIDAYVSEFQIGVKRTSGTNSYIAGHESFNYDAYIGKTTRLTTLFYAIAGYFGVPLSDIFGNANGKLTGSKATNNSYINVKVSSLGNVKFDGSDEYTSIVYQLAKSSSGTTTYQSYADITYVIDTLHAAFFVDTYTARESFNMSF